MPNGWERFWGGAGRVAMKYLILFLLGLFAINAVGNWLNAREKKDEALADVARMRDSVVPMLRDSADAAWDSLGVIGDTVTVLTTALLDRPIEYVTLTRTIRLQGETILRVDTIPAVVIAGDTVPVPEALRTRLQECDALALTCQAQTQQIATVKLANKNLIDSLDFQTKRADDALAADFNFWFIHLDATVSIGFGATYNILPCSDSDSPNDEITFDGDTLVVFRTKTECSGRAGIGPFAGVALSF